MKYECGPCGYVYDPAEGDPDNGIAPGTAFEDLPEDWVCPVCGASKEEFSLPELLSRIFPKTGYAPSAAHPKKNSLRWNKTLPAVFFDLEKRFDLEERCPAAATQSLHTRNLKPMKVWEVPFLSQAHPVFDCLQP